MMEEQKCEYCVWYDIDDKLYQEVVKNWCNKWEVPTDAASFCGWYVPKDE